jgi:hypothetical protein
MKKLIAISTIAVLLLVVAVAAYAATTRTVRVNIDDTTIIPGTGNMTTWDLGWRFCGNQLGRSPSTLTTLALRQQAVADWCDREFRKALAADLKLTADDAARIIVEQQAAALKTDTAQ